MRWFATFFIQTLFEVFENENVYTVRKKYEKCYEYTVQYGLQ